MSLPMPYSQADGEKVRVRVYRDHPAWDEVDARGMTRRWWQQPAALLRELFVASYEVESCAQLDWLEREFPEHVFVY